MLLFRQIFLLEGGVYFALSKELEKWSQSSFNQCTNYPDFTIRNPRTGKLLYWEHFGKIDDPDYAHKTSRKLNTYISNNIIPDIDLITTYETKDHPLSISTLEFIRTEFLT